MKKIFKITTVSALVMLSANVMADATGNFKWVGSITSTNITDGTIKITNTGDTVHTSGTIILDEEGENTGKYIIDTSSEMSFDVVGADESDTEKFETHVDYYYTLTNLTYQVGGGLMSEDTSEIFYISDEDIAIDKNVKTSSPSTESTLLKLNTNTAFEASSGDAVVVQATLLVSTEVI
ncbi:MAG: hypothetical protein V5789_12320 [Colwellia sp.]